MNKEQLERIPRYAYEGGFTIAFNPGYRIVIEIVCAGFDCHETRRGVAWHERFIVPWEEAEKLHRVQDLRQPFIKKEVATIADYRKSAKQRLDYLVDGHGYDAANVLEFLPMKEPVMVSTSIEGKILEEVILPSLVTIQHGGTVETIYNGDIIAGTIVQRKHKHRKPRSKELAS